MSATTTFDEDNMGNMFYEGYEDDSFFATPDTTNTEATDYFENSNSCGSATFHSESSTHPQSGFTNLGSQFVGDPAQESVPFATEMVEPLYFTDNQPANQWPEYSNSLYPHSGAEAIYQDHHLQNESEAFHQNTHGQSTQTSSEQQSRTKLQRKRYKCDTAGCTANPLGFTRKKDMDRHVRERHKGERPFVCSSKNFTSDLRCTNAPDVGCSKSFKRIGHLKTHWAKKKMDKRFKAGADASLRATKEILGLNKRLRQKSAERKSAVRKERETGSIIRRFTGISL